MITIPIASYYAMGVATSNNSSKMSVQLFNANCYHALKGLPDNSIDLVVADPPYEIKSDGGGKTSLKSMGKYKDGSLDDIKDGFDLTILYEFKRLMPKYNAFIFCSNDQVPDLCLFAREFNYFYTILVWNKTNSIPFSNGVWRQDIEFAVNIRQSGATFLGDAKLKTKVVSLPIEISKYGHPTEKPLELVKKYIKIGSKPGDTVLDPFMGSGTTGHAAVQLGRKFIGYEIRQDYFEIAQKRINGVNGMLEDLPMFATK